jgi:hypothetical protein
MKVVQPMLELLHKKNDPGGPGVCHHPDGY